MGAIQESLLKTRVGILGGTFNPVHLGHLVTAQDALELLGLDKIFFVPSARPPHKNAKLLIPIKHRLSMLKSALKGNPDFEICELEIRHRGTDYSIDTVRRLIRSYPKKEFLFIIGSDSLKELHQWKSINELLRLCRFATLARPGFEVKAFDAKDLKLASRQLASGLLNNIVYGHQVNISSSDIRRRLAQGLNIRYLVPPAVERYIAKHKLYHGNS